MLSRRMVGAVLMLAGAILMVWGGVSWLLDSNAATVIDGAPIEQVEPSLGWVWLATCGGLITAGGAVLLAVSSRRRS